MAIFALYVLTSYCAGYILQQDGLRFLKAWEAAATLQTLPVFAALFAVLFLHETVAPLQIAGVLAVIVGGIIIARGSPAEELPAVGASDVGKETVAPPPPPEPSQ